MGVCASVPDRNGQRLNAEIEMQLQRDRKQQQTEVKMLLLGAGESGKTTILKQMKIINEGGYSAQEKRVYKSIVYSNVISSMKTILDAMDTILGIPLADPASLAPLADLVRAAPDQIPAEETFPTDLSKAIQALWQDAGVQAAYKRSGAEYHLTDSAKYFFDDFARISSPTYTPTDQDVLRCRVKTTGITETTFNIGDLTYRMFDVGGQRSERKKWIHCFENVTAIIFLVALSEYDQKLVEDGDVNRMVEAFTLFDTVCNSRWFVKTSVILFLNKVDLFKDKIYEVPIEDYYDDYEGGDDFEAACAYFKDRFVQLNQYEAKTIYAHYTCATDTEQIRFVMEAVNDIIIQNSLRQAGLM